MNSLTPNLYCFITASISLLTSLNYYIPIIIVADWQCRRCGYRDANSKSPYNMFYSLSKNKALNKSPAVTPLMY